MAVFRMQDNSESFRAFSTEIFARSECWNVDMTNPADSRTANNSGAALPIEFGCHLEFYDSSKDHSVAGQIDIDMKLQMRMMTQMAVMQLGQAMINRSVAEWANQSGSGNGDGLNVGNIWDGHGSHHCDHDRHESRGGDAKSGSDSGTKSGSDNGTKSGSDSGTKSGTESGTKSGSDSGTKSGSDSGTKSGADSGTKSGSDGQHESDNAPKYADTPVKRGRTVYRTDFNGSKGEHPDGDVFDTQHIGPTGLTRQRGESIHENAIISDNNSVMDGEGHLQLFAQKQKTYDPVAKEYVDYTKGSFNTGKDKADHEKGLTFNLKDYPNGLVIETRAMHPKNAGTKFDALWIMTKDWAADPAKGQKRKDTIEYDAAEGGGAGITVHYPEKDASGKSVDHFGGSAHMDLQDGKYHTYTVAISHNGDVVEYVDGKEAFAKKAVFPTDKELHLRASLEVSPKWTKKTYTGNGGMNSDGAGYIDYLDVSEMKP
ncbi:MAG: hypothetical protein EKK48_21360 [Candidatus Melainabacteria bacterium]|nr:MAG: hypothetical protein EKK48_21360 [Candidatus Melainabacteria bacterium]